MFNLYSVDQGFGPAYFYILGNKISYTHYEIHDLAEEAEIEITNPRLTTCSKKELPEQLGLILHGTVKYLASFNSLKTIKDELPEFFI